MPRKFFDPGTHGAIVGDIQRAFLAAGLDPKGIDESYGRNTAAAVRTFQKGNNLKSTGFVDENTWQM